MRVLSPHHQSPLPSQDAKAPSHRQASPVILLMVVSAAVFVTEALVMLLLFFLPLADLAKALLDAFLLILIVVPLLYLFWLRPMTRQEAERRQAELALQKSGELLEKLFSVTHVLIAYMDPQFNFIRVNRAFAEADGQAPEFYPGKNHFVLFPNSENENIFRQVVETGQPYFIYEKSFEYAEYPERGLTYWDWSLQPVKEAGGEVSGLILSLIDVTQRVKAQQALLESERRFRAIFNQTFQFIGLVQPDGSLLGANQTALAFAGANHTEVTGRPLWETPWWRHSLEAQERLKVAVAEAAQGQFVRYEVEVSGRDEARLLIDFSLKPVLDDQGQVILLIQEGRDITKRKQAENALREAHAGLELRVQERTIELAEANARLSKANTALQAEIEERLQVEEELREALEISRQRQAEVAALLVGARAVMEHRQFVHSARAIFNSVKQVTGATTGFVALIKDEYDEVVIMDNGEEPGKSDPAQLTPVRSLWAHVYQSGQTTFENNFAASQWSGLPPESNTRIENILIAPLAINAVVVGILGLANKPGGFKADDVRMATAFGELVAISLLNRRAEQALREAHTELELRVQKRTAELELANQGLRAEIAERKRIEAQLHLQTTAVEAAANGIIVTDLKGVIQWCNPAFARMTGYSAQEILGQNARFLNSGMHPPEFFQGLWKTILSGQVWQGEIINRRLDGSHYHEEQIITPVLDEDGRITHFIAIKQDITDRKHSAQQLERQNQELLALSQAEQSQRLFAESLVQAATAINTSLNLNEVLNQILDQIRRVIPYQAADIALLEGENVLVAHQHDFDDLSKAQASMQQRFSPESSPLFMKMVHTNQPVLVEDMQASPEWLEATRPGWIRACLAAPLLRGEQVIGFIKLMSKQPGFFSGEMRDRLVAFAVHAVAAIQNARLYEAELRARQTAEILCASSQSLTQSLSLSFVTNTLLDHLRQLVPYDSASVLLLEDESRLVVRAARGYERWTNLEQIFSITFDANTNSHIQTMIRTQKSFLIPDTFQQPGWEIRPGTEHIRNFLGVPFVAGGKVIGLCGLDQTQPGFFTPEHVQWAEALVGQAAVALQNAWLFEQVRAGRERLQSLSHRLVEIQEAERRYIARELHDETGQVLTSLMVGLRLLERDADQPAAVRDGLNELKRLVDGVLEDLHRLAMDLRPASLDYLGLVAALRQHFEALSNKHDLVIDFEAIRLENRLPPNFETALYRIVQEALTNIIRHAGATRADILLEQRGDKLILIVEDNGIGFDPTVAMRGTRLGLFGMRERAEMLGGALVVESAAGRGTTLCVEVPYAHTDPDRR